MPSTPFTLRLAVAGIPFRVELPVATWVTSLEARYAAFLDDAASFAPAGWQVKLVNAVATGAEAPWIAHDDVVTRFAIDDFVGWIDLRAQRAEATALDAGRAAMAIDRLLAYICMLVLPREHRGLLLHGAAIVWQGVGLAFCGHSGAGKTTVARLAAGAAEVLTDETLVIALDGPQPLLLSTPFWGASTPVELIRRVQRQAPLRALFLLEHAPLFELERLDAGQAVLALLLTEKVAIERVSSADAWLDMADELVSRAPVYRLRFRPTAELWPFLAAHL